MGNLVIALVLTDASTSILCKGVAAFIQNDIIGKVPYSTGPAF
jgi:hypothetical protein